MEKPGPATTGLELAVVNAILTSTRTDDSMAGSAHRVRCRLRSDQVALRLVGSPCRR